MRASQSALRILLGMSLILHGVGNSVLPLRGADVLEPGSWSAAMTLLYVIAIVGFVASGLGILGVRPLRRVAGNLALAAGACALGAQVWYGDTSLWAGIALSVVLPILAKLATDLWTVRDAAPSASRWRQATDAAGLAFLAWVAVSAVAWPWHRTWGTTPVEWNAALPGDRAPRTPGVEILHGVTIDAPPSAVWPWLVQIGQDRAGFYSYERLERLFGAEIHNASDIRLEWQSRRVGDRVHATQPGYLGGLFGDRPGWTIDLLEPERALVLRGWGAFVLQPLPDGRTRFLIRSTISNERIPVWAAALNFTLFELPHFIMQRRMMLGIKARAERST